MEMPGIEPIKQSIFPQTTAFLITSYASRNLVVGKSKKDPPGTCLKIASLASQKMLKLVMTPYIVICPTLTLLNIPFFPLRGLWVAGGALHFQHYALAETEASFSWTLALPGPSELHPSTGSIKVLRSQDLKENGLHFCHPHTENGQIKGQLVVY